jgi:hypothetical protein
MSTFHEVGLDGLIAEIIIKPNHPRRELHFERLGRDAGDFAQETVCVRSKAENLVVVTHGRDHDRRVGDVVEPEVSLKEGQQRLIHLEGIYGDIGPHLGRDRREVAKVSSYVGETPTAL